MSRIITLLEQNVITYEETLFECFEETKKILDERYYKHWYERNNNSDFSHRGHLMPVCSLRRDKVTKAVKTVEIRWYYSVTKTRKQHKYSGMHAINKGKGFKYPRTHLKKYFLDWEYELALEAEERLARMRKVIANISKVKKSIKATIRSIKRSGDGVFF